MIEIIVSDGYAGQANNDQIEHTRQVRKPECMMPQWKEVLTFDVIKPTDEIAI